MRIRETGGGTLNIQELYFDNEINCQAMNTYSQSEWISTSNKNAQGIPGSYYIDRQIQPYLLIYPVSNGQRNALLYSYKSITMDISALTQRIDVPQRFYRVLVMELAAELALEMNPELYPALSAKAAALWESAAGEDTQNVPYRIHYTQESM